MRHDHDRLRVALIHEVFADVDTADLVGCLQTARERGAELAVLPELPLNRWAPATRRVDDDDAEPPDGPRARVQAEAARNAGLAILGGAIVRDTTSGRRHNTALLFDANGALRGSYRKLHLPDEPGFWEAHHYEPGDVAPHPIDGLPLRTGIQICSDVNRPEGCRLLSAQGAELILVPRATPPESYDRWRCVLRANAITACAYVISVNRPRAEDGAPIGGPSLAIGPDGEVLLETTETVSVATLERAAIHRARRDYPGYLSTRSDLYARGWKSLDS